MNQIDITVSLTCIYCNIDHPFGGPFAISETSTLGLGLVHMPLACTKCGRMLYIHIQGHPYDLANHLDNSVAVALYNQVKKDQKI